MMPFIEILNFYSNSDAELTIHVIEEIEIEIPDDLIYLINIGQVTITTFSRLNLVASTSTLISSDTPYSLENPKTLFRTMSDTTTDLSAALETAMATIRDTSEVTTAGSLFQVYRSSLSISNINFKTTSDESSLNYFRVVNRGENVLRIDNCMVESANVFLYSQDNLNLEVVDTSFIYTSIGTAFHLDISCDYDDASLTGDILLSNVIVEPYDEDSSMDDFLFYTGSSNITITDSHIMLSMGYFQAQSPIRFESTAVCDPNDGLPEIVSMSNTIVEFIGSQPITTFAQTTMSVSPDYNREVQIVQTNVTYYSQDYETIIALSVMGSNNTILELHDTVFSDTYYTESIIYISGVGSILGENLSFEHITQGGTALINAERASTVVFNELSVNNCTFTDDGSSYLLVDFIDTDNIITIYSSHFSTLNVMDRKLIDVVSAKQVEITYTTFEDIGINPDNDMITMGTPGYIYIVYNTYNGVYSNEEGIGITNMIQLTALDLEYEGVYKVERSTISNCTLSFMHVAQIQGNPGSRNDFEMTELYFTDTVYQKPVNLITFSMYDETQDFRIYLRS